MKFIPPPGPEGTRIPFDAFPGTFAEPPLHPDAELLDLAGTMLSKVHELGECRKALHATAARVGGTRWPTEAESLLMDGLGARLERAAKSDAMLARAAGALRATTPAGLMAKALMVRASKSGCPALARSMAEDLLASPELRRVLFPAEVV